MKIIMNNLKIFLFLTFVTGVIYPLFVTVFSQMIFNHEANGSLVVKEGKVRGSKLLAQGFSKRQYFWPRPSISNYDSANSSASNLSPDSKMLNEQMIKRAHDFEVDVKSYDDLLFASGSSLDPHISPESAQRQIARIASTRQLDRSKTEELKKLIADNTEGRQFGLLGRARLNVLKLNLILDTKF